MPASERPGADQSKPLQPDPPTFCSEPGVMAQRAGDELVLLDTRTEQYLAMNEVGARTWELLMAGCSINEAIDFLYGEFAADRSAIETDVGAFIETLLGLELIVEKPR